MSEQIAINHMNAANQDRSLGDRLRYVYKVVAVGVASVALAACSADSSSAEQDARPAIASKVAAHALPSNAAFLDQAGNSLLAMGNNHAGLRFRSALQAPNYQTDADVGATGVIRGFAAMAERKPHDKRWKNAETKTAKWLTSVSKQDGQGGRFWPDYANDHKVSPNTYTSFDDGALGVGNSFWELGQATHNIGYKKIAKQTVDWTLSKAENIGTNGQEVFRWKWDAAANNSSYQLGMGEGAVGIIHTLATYYQRIQHTDPTEAAKIKRYIDGGLRYIERAKTNLGSNDGDSRALPETGEIGQDGDTIMNSGYLSGTAGEALMYLKLHQVFGGKKYLGKAKQALTWLEDTQNGPMVRPGPNMVSWKISLDPQGDDNTKYATGFEEGAAGIGWVELQAYKVTGNKHYLAIAEQAANWLIHVAVKPTSSQMAWREYEHPGSKLKHANLNNGAAGIGMFLKDLSLINHKAIYQVAAQESLNWLKATAIHKGKNIYWKDDGGIDPDTGKSSPYIKDPSWHWGTAGIIEFAARMNGGKIDIPGEQPGF